MSTPSALARARKEWTVAVPQKHYTIKNTSQHCRCDLVLHVIMAKASDDDPLTIWISLDQSSISSGTMKWDQDDKRGYYQDKIELEMWLCDRHGKPLKDFNRVSDGPKTVNGSSSTSSSVSFSFSSSLSANVGFFGGTPTGGGGAGVNVGATQSHSFARNLSDFRAVNDSDDLRARHTYKMMASSGGAYRKATDLVPDGDEIGFFDAFKGIELYNPPDLALHNFPIISQAVWQADDNNDRHHDIYAKIQIKQRVMLVDGRNDFVKVHGHSGGWTLGYGHREKLPLGDLVRPPEPATL